MARFLTNIYLKPKGEAGAQFFVGDSPSGVPFEIYIEGGGLEYAGIDFRLTPVQARALGQALIAAGRSSRILEALFESERSLDDDEMPF